MQSLDKFRIFFSGFPLAKNIKVNQILKQKLFKLKILTNKEVEHGNPRHFVSC
jgi:hypothetical protein